MPTIGPAQQQAAIAWLNEKFGVEERKSGNTCPVEIRQEDGNVRVTLIDKEGRRWRLSEVLAAYREESNG